jgi:hypothetical protein
MAPETKRPKLIRAWPRRPPARRRFPARRAGSQRRDDAPLEFSAKLETAVIGVLRFLAGIAGIVWRIVSAPRGLERKLTRSGRLAPYVPAHTFLALAAFLAVKSLRVLLTTVLLGMLAFERSCAPETQQDVVYPSFADAVQIPSLEQVLFTVAPVVVLVLLLIHALVHFAKARPDGSQQRLLSLCVHVVGFQYLLLLAAVFVTTRMPTKGEQVDIWMTSVAVAYVLLVILWPTLLLTLRFTRAKERGGRSRAMHLLVAFGFALAVCAGSQLAGLLVTYPLSRADLLRQLAPRPVIETALLQGAPSDDSAFVLTLAVTNRSDGDLFLSPEHVGFQYRWNDTFRSRMGYFSADGKRIEQSIPLRRGESKILRVVIVTTAAGLSRSCDAALDPLAEDESWMGKGDDSIFKRIGGLADFRYPVPASVRGRMCFGAVNAAGEALDLASFAKRARD